MDTIAIDNRKQKKVDKKVSKLKERIKKGLQVKQDIKKTLKAKKSDSRGVVYLGHIPHGFYEQEIRKYSEQFGVVTRVRVARSPKTGRSKGYAFIEFLLPEVAKIFAETINNYLMFNRLLVCKYIPPETRHRSMFWSGAEAGKFKAQRTRKMDTQRKNKTKPTPIDDDNKKSRRKIEDFKSFFEQRGIEFNFKVNDPGCEAPATSQERREAVLVIDESDDEVEFNVPPDVIKVYKSDLTKKLTPRQSNVLNTKNIQLMKSLKKAVPTKQPANTAKQTTPTTKQTASKAKLTASKPKLTASKPKLTASKTKKLK